MTTTVILTRFGQEIPPLDTLGALPRGIATAIGDGRPAQWAGFLWYHPCATLAVPLEHQREGWRIAA